MKNILKYLSKQKGLAIGFLILMLFVAVLGLINPMLTANMVTALEERNLKLMECYAILAAEVSIAWALFRYLVRGVAVDLKAKIGKSLETDLCKIALNVKSCFLNGFESGELAQITKSNPSEFLQKLLDTVMQAVNLVTAVAVAVYVFFLSKPSFILFLIFFMIIFVVQNSSLKKEEKGSEKEKRKNDSAKSLINQIYRAVQDIKVLNMKMPIFERYNTLLTEEIEANVTKENTKSKNRLFINISFEIYSIAFITLGVYLMHRKIMDMSTFITIFMYKWQLYNLAFEQAEIRSNWKEMSVLARRMNKLLLIEPYKLESFGKVNGTISDSHIIEVTDLTFSYGNNENVLENVSFKVSEGEVIGVAGASGSAKTTLIKLIARQLEPKSGSIKIDGIDISDFSEEGFTNMVSLVSQDPYIFSLSIRENLLLVKPNATEAEMWKALDEANVLHFIRSLPNGLDTVLSENVEISGGQKQRLAIARVFLKDTPIVLLDEATSAVDNETQSEITELIKAKAEKDGKIFICIAHRIEAIRDADRIIFLENGRIVNTGTHEQLSQDSRYVNLFKIISIA